MRANPRLLSDCEAELKRQPDKTGDDYEVADFQEPTTFEWTKESYKISQAVKKFSESTETDLT